MSRRVGSSMSWDLLLENLAMVLALDHFGDISFYSREQLFIGLKSWIAGMQTLPADAQERSSLSAELGHLKPVFIQTSSKRTLDSGSQETCPHQVSFFSSAGGSDAAQGFSDFRGR